MSELENDDTNTTSTDGTASVIGIAASLFAVTIPALGLQTLAATIIALDWRKNPSVAKQLVLALIVTDIVGILSIIVHIFVKTSFSTAAFLCYIFDIIQVFSMQVSGFIATTMAIERTLAFKSPYWYRRNVTAKVAWILLLVQTLCSLFISIFPIIGLGSVNTVTVVNGVKVEKCGIFPFVQLRGHREAVFTLTYSTVGAVFLVVVVLCNMLSIREMKRMQSVVIWPQDNPLQRPEFRMTKLLLALSGTFVMCWSPLIVMLSLAQAGVYIDIPSRITVLAIASLNFIFDSGVYLSMNKKYRQNILRICCRPSSVGTIEEHDGR